MFNAEFWQEIKEKYPRTWIKVRRYSESVISKAISQFCYCDLEKFFWNHDIRLCSILNSLIINEETKDGYDLIDYLDFQYYKLATVKKAFEIMEASNEKDN